MALSQALYTRQLRFSIPNAHERTNSFFSEKIRVVAGMLGQAGDAQALPAEGVHERALEAACCR